MTGCLQKMIEITMNLPGKVLSSPAYNVGTLTSNAVMQGCPASTLLDLTFQDKLLERTGEERQVHFIEYVCVIHIPDTKVCYVCMNVIISFQCSILRVHFRFFIIMEKLMGHGITNPVGALGFLQTCTERLEGNVNKLATDVMWRMWSVIVNPLLEHIMKVSVCTINQCQYQGSRRDWKMGGHFPVREFCSDWKNQGIYPKYWKINSKK